MNFAMNAKNFFKKNMISKNCFGVLDITMAIFKKFAEKKILYLIIFFKKKDIYHIYLFIFLLYIILLLFLFTTFSLYKNKIENIKI